MKVHTWCGLAISRDCLQLKWCDRASYLSKFSCINISVDTIVNDYRKIFAEVSNQQQSIVSFDNWSVAENSGIFYIYQNGFTFTLLRDINSNFLLYGSFEMESESMCRFVFLTRDNNVQKSFRLLNKMRRTVV